jgi:hypothetical protein
METETKVVCRVFGNCLCGDLLDRELGSLMPCDGPLAANQRLFTYVRYNAELTRAGLDAIGCHGVQPEAVRKLDAIDSLPALRDVGQRVATKVSAGHFVGFPAI